MTRLLSPTDGVLTAVRKFSRPDDHGVSKVDVSVVMSYTGLSRSEVTSAVHKLAEYGATLAVDDEGEAIETGKQRLAAG